MTKEEIEQEIKSMEFCVGQDQDKIKIHKSVISSAQSDIKARLSSINYYNMQINYRKKQLKNKDYDN